MMINSSSSGRRGAGRYELQPGYLTRYVRRVAVRVSRQRMVQKDPG
jgi:hypothetical protein